MNSYSQKTNCCPKLEPDKLLELCSSAPAALTRWSNDTYPIGLRERWKSLSTLSTSLFSLQSLPSFTKEDLQSHRIMSGPHLTIKVIIFHISSSLTDSWWRRGLQGRWQHQSCWRPAWTGLAFASFLDRGWSELPRSSCSYVTARNNHKYYLMELVKSGVCTYGVKCLWAWSISKCISVSKQAYRFSPEPGCFLTWSITCICCWFGANIWKRAPLRLRWYMVLDGGQSCQLPSLQADTACVGVNIPVLILTTLPHGHQSHPTSHILRKPVIYIFKSQ